MELPKTARPIEGARDHWVDIDGSIYAVDHRCGRGLEIIKKKLNPCWGYLYAGIYYNDEKRIITKRVHRLVAEAFIPNPDSLPIVGHKNNIKDDNRVENLYWTTESENTQKAVNDGLLVNDKGFDDSQSQPVNMYDVFSGNLIGTYGSVCETSKATAVGKNTIIRQARDRRPVRHNFYFRFASDPDQSYEWNIVVQRDYDSDKVVGLFYNTWDAWRRTGINDRTINQQCRTRKPKRKFMDTYFQYMKNTKAQQLIKEQETQDE